MANSEADPLVLDASSSKNDEIIVVNETESYSDCEYCENNGGDDAYPAYLTRRNTKRTSRRSRGPRRLVLKSGRPQVHRARRPWLAIIYVHDLANTLIHAPWKWTLLALSLAFMFTWTAFACVWMMIADMDAKNGTETPCLSGIQSFAGYLLFSIETQATIGYGNRFITHHCPEAALVLCLQISAGVCVCGLLISIVYEKISGPRKLNSKNCFSKVATICQRDGELCLIFRVRDCDRRYQCHNEIKAYLVQKRGHELLLKSIKLESIGILIWPIEVVHKITETSPFWDLSARDLIMKRFEIIAAMEGTSLSTSNTSSTTTSYLSNEILWGHTFKPCVDYDKESNCYSVNHKFFNSTRELTMPLCSAQRLRQVLDDYTLLNEAVFFFDNSPSFSDDGKNGHCGSATLSSPVTVHASMDGQDAVISEKSGDSGFVCNGGQRISRQKVDALLVSLQKFLKVDNGGKACYSETAL